MGRFGLELGLCFGHRDPEVLLDMKDKPEGQCSVGGWSSWGRGMSVNKILL